MTTKKKDKTNTKNNENLNSAIRVSSEVGKLLKEEVEKLNKRKHGSKKINVSELIRISMSLLNEEHRVQILSNTVTSEDRQRIAFTNYTKKHKGVSKADFLDLIQYGEIQINEYLPEDMKRQKKPNNVKGLDAA